MAMTLWIHTLEDGRYARDERDHSWMHRLSDELDEFCVEAEVTRLSEFFDFTSLDRNRSGEFVEDFGSGLGDVDDEDDDLEASDLDDEDADGEEGLDEMAWFESEQGLESLGVALAAANSGALAEIGDRQVGDLIEELENCIKVLEDTATRGGKFHLAVVE